MATIDLTPFLDLRRHLKIAHHIPGRIRLRVGASVFKDLGKVDTQVFDKILGAIEGIRDVRVNVAAGSVVIAYTPTVIQSSWWETLLKADDNKAVALLQRLLDAELAPAIGMVHEQGTR